MTATDRNDDIVYLSATQLAQLVRARKLSAVEIVEAHIDRHLAINDMLNAVVIVPGKPGDSELLLRVSDQNEATLTLRAAP